MPQGPDGSTIIIVKKVSGHGGAHGGAWKVAYADFVTAMMALFMVLWLVNTASVTTRERIASYFQRPGVFDEGSGTPLEIGGGGILGDTFGPPASANAQTVPTKYIYDVESEGGLKNEGFAGGEKDANDFGENEGLGKGADGEGNGEGGGTMMFEYQEFQRMQAEIERSLAGEAGLGAGEGGKGGGSPFDAGMLGQMSVSVDQRGLHLEIMDTPTASMFNLGSSQIRGEAREKLLEIASMLVRLPNPIDIEGHTDARPFRSRNLRGYDNWNLSADRANAARRVLERAGVKPWQINRVVGFADSRPKVPTDPLAPSNRRISVSMRYTEQAAVALRGTGANETRSVPVNSRQAIAPAPEPEKKVEEEKENKATLDTTPLEDEDLASAAQVAEDEDDLRVEMSTSYPQGQPLAGADDNESSARPGWMQKDKIFGFDNPFAR